MQTPFLTWCDERIADCAAQEKILKSDGRADEAVHVQIQSNVYGIFRSVHTALKGDRALVLDRLAKIPTAWEKHLALAEAHGDSAAAHIERIKLQTVEEIRAFLTAQEEKHDGE